MLAKLLTHSLLGIEARAVDVEVDISPGAMPKTILVGLAEASVRESTHRVERAIVNSGYNRPIETVTSRPHVPLVSGLRVSLGLAIRSRPSIPAMCSGLGTVWAHHGGELWPRPRLTN